MTSDYGDDSIQSDDTNFVDRWRLRKTPKMAPLFSTQVEKSYQKLETYRD